MRLIAVAIAKAPKTSSINANAYSQLNPNDSIVQAPPTATNSKPMLSVLKALRSYLPAFSLRITAKARIQMPKSRRTTGAISVQPMAPAA